MREKKLITKKPAGGRYREGYCGDEVCVVEANQFFTTYSDGSRKVRDIKIDYDDYTSMSYEEMKRNISENIYRLRVEKNLSCGDVAWRVGVSRQYIAQIERGERNVTLEILSKIAKVLCVDVNFLIKESPFKSSNIYIDRLVAEIKDLPVAKQKELCASVIEKLWS